MRRDSPVDPGKAKSDARKNYTERKLNKWIEWSWNVRGRVIYKELIEQINKYERRD
jgi:hypothetical protein